MMWRLAPVLALTVRQFLGGKAIRVVIGLAFLPTIFALIFLIDSTIDDNWHYLGDTIFVDLVIPTLLPLTVLVLATSAFGDEIEDRTLPYLVLKPVARLRLVVEKLIASVIVSGPIAMAGMAATYALIMRGDWNDHLRLLGAITAAIAIATVAYSAIFMLVSLLISRALVAALIYSLIWESILGRYVPGLRYVSIRHFVRSVFAGIAEND
ncbi:MAG: ABC transporter permease, partial [Thermomicrobiales bacterium]|nr:ABC transporter permease [Thermomicrobiales bacterium]